MDKDKSSSEGNSASSWPACPEDVQAAAPHLSNLTGSSPVEFRAQDLTQKSLFWVFVTALARVP